MALAAPRRGAGRGTSLAPSSSTVYVSNLPFSLTNNDLTKIFEKFGKVVRVTILRDKETRKSRGVAFLLYLTREEAQTCVDNTDGCILFGRTVKASIAKDNGRAPEFIRRREYPDKSRCYECGEFGHLSYACPNNLLGDREPPKKKSKKRKKEAESKANKFCKSGDTDEEVDEEEENFEDESLSAAIRYQQELREAETFQERISVGHHLKETEEKHKAKIKKSSYFSDEEELSDC
ncbi:zinc finger CCHC-type and RNA-binding motif-containing protein 1-like [Portunus trituberculatus]|uniref:zinc finger CCHC-type and RNA-binding motif-containing protein 1-like n=1 Tax=Portunus trituberculatus TaxID=210409 RepID=UPI001E1CDA98|nr:zinc finger CCHC-type and RNA-binding motif-containing protein 1-like [Portunus trituberculatus]XP_045114985.1 zinc finger CCHC-type and RNA-binding motif-containing protein 1-like [Portunus trituberculatus]